MQLRRQMEVNKRLLDGPSAANIAGRPDPAQNEPWRREAAEALSVSVLACNSSYHSTCAALFFLLHVHFFFVGGGGACVDCMLLCF